MSIAIAKKSSSLVTCGWSDLGNDAAAGLADGGIDEMGALNRSKRSSASPDASAFSTEARLVRVAVGGGAILGMNSAPVVAFLLLGAAMGVLYHVSSILH